MSHAMRGNRGYVKPKVIENFMWSLGQKRKDDAGDTRMRAFKMGDSMMKKKINEH